MQIIPVVNCQDFDCVKQRVQTAQESLFPLVKPEDRWLHIDIADGGFTKGYETWRNPTDLSSLKLSPEIKIELHLMVNEPEQAMEAWLATGISRLIFHLESTASLDVIVAACHSRGVEPMLAISPATPAPHALPYLAGFSSCQLLAVEPGKAGQEFEEHMYEKIKTIHTRFPDMVIEVDGGVTPETAPNIKAAGASILTAGSTIFESPNPVAVFRKYLEL